MSTFRDENPHWKPAPSGTQFFKKSKKRSETRFGPLLMSSGRLVLFSGESEHFFFRRKCGSENKKKISKNSNGWSCGQSLVKSSSKDPPHHAYKDRTIKKKSICGHSMLRFDLGILTSSTCLIFVLYSTLIRSLSCAADILLIQAVIGYSYCCSCSDTT